jgi:hypothetical protein
LGILPITGDSVEPDQKGRYSLPACLGEFCANGLPLVVITGRDTLAQETVNENELGIAIDPSDSKLAVRTLSHFILDQQWRAECGKKARYFAEKKMNISRYQAELYNRIQDLSKQKPLKRVDGRDFSGLNFHE